MPPFAPLTFLPALLVMLSVVAFAATTTDQRQAAAATLVGVIGITVIWLVFDIPNGLIGVAGFAVTGTIVAATVGVVADSERQLRSHLGSLVEGLDAIVWERDPTTLRFSYVSARAEEILGYPREDWLRDDFWIDHLHPDDRHAVLEGTERAITDGRDHELEYRMVAEDGRLVHLHDVVTVTTDATGRAVMSQGATIDVTERRRVEERVHQYADLVETIDLGLLVFRLEDRDDVHSLRLVAANPAANAAVQLPLDTYLGERILTVFPELRTAELPKRLADVVRTGQPFQIDDLVLRPGRVRSPDQPAEEIHALMAFPLRGDAVGVSLQDVTATSVRNLYDPELPDFVAEVLADTGFPASELTLELTETELMDDPKLALEVLSELGRLGVGTAVDDFGTGYSSLTYLKDLPIREIKVDRSFVAEMHRRTDEFTIVRSMIDLGHNLGLQVVAEGVEHAADLESLDRLGCDLVQGYHLSRPLPIDLFLAWLASHDDVPVSSVACLPDARSCSGSVVALSEQPSTSMPSTSRR